MMRINFSVAAALAAGVWSGSTAYGQCDPVERGHLFASDGAEFTYFGVSVAIDGDTAVVGNPDDDTGRGSNAGSAYVFVRENGVWKEKAHLFASDGAQDDLFGGAVAISGDTIVVGASNDNTAGGADAGSAYVFVRKDGTWKEDKHLFASDGAAGDLFGGSVTMSGDTVVVAAFRDNTSDGTDAGSVYVYTRSDGIWTETDHLFASDGAAGDQFGDWVVMSNDTLLVGAYLDNTSGGADAGSAYVFVRDDDGRWTEQDQLLASDGAPGDRFGYSLAISGDTAVVGALLDDTEGGTDAGSAYVFTRTDGKWTEQAHLFASDGAADDVFTTDMGLSGDVLIVGAARDDTPAGVNAGSAYVFRRSGDAWSEESRILASDGAADDRFGYCVAMSGSSVAVGAWGDDTFAGTDAGSAYIFELQCRRSGDLNCDGSVDFNDIDPFVTALISRDDYESQYPGCDWSNADINRDESIDFNDIDGFVECLINGGCE